MKEKRIVHNIVQSVFLQVALAISGFILPKLIIIFFGSEINGLVSSINQFLVYISLVEAGIGDSATVALYKPIVKKNRSDINNVMCETTVMYNKAGLCYTLLACLLAIIYPVFIKGQVSYLFAVVMVLVLMCNGIIDYFLLGKYKVFLIANQKYYIYNFVRMLFIILTLVISICLINNNYGIIAVKFIGIVIHLFEWIIIVFYIKNQYPQIDFGYKSKNKTKYIAQRKNALIHQLAAIIVYNTDLVVLTLFFPKNSLLEISVFTVYLLVYNLINNLAGSSLISGVDAIFGELFAKKENTKLQNGYKQFELVCFFVQFILYSTAFSSITPFINCYTLGINDANYTRYGVGFLIIINGILANIKNPSKTAIISAGHFKQTQKYAIMEAAINVVISVILVRRLGIVGVLLGTMCSNIYRDCMTIWYNHKFLITKTLKVTIKRLFVFFSVFTILTIIETNIFPETYLWKEWIIYTSKIFVINIFIFTLTCIIFEKDNVKELLIKIKKVFI